MNRNQEVRGVVLTGYSSNTEAFPAPAPAPAPGSSSGREPTAPGPR